MPRAVRPPRSPHGGFILGDLARAFLERVAGAGEGSDGGALALEFAAEVDATLSPLVAAAGAVAVAPLAFKLRRAVELAEQLASAEDGAEEELESEAVEA